MQSNYGKNTLLAALIGAALTACGGGGGSDNGGNIIPPPADPAAPTPKPNGAQGVQVANQEITLGDIVLPPHSAARPDAATQAKLDAVVAGSNQLRAEKGLPPLANNESLSAYATIRAQESAAQGKNFQHVRPAGEGKWSDNRYFEGNRGAAAENLAAGSAEAATTVNQWRNSPGHYANIMNPNLKALGVGYHQDTNAHWKHYWAQIFTGGSNSIYRYISPLDRNAALNAVRNAVQYDGNGRLSLRNQTITLGQDHRITLRAPETFGWSYQTFGEISDTRGIPEAYLNLGKPFVPNDGATMQADYRGKMVGDLAQSSRVSADVAAHLDYGAARKTISLQIENATRDKQRDTRLDFSDTLNWNGKAQRFESETGNARLYGPNGEELGGQFSRRVGSDAYRGAYGAKKVQ